MLITRKQRIETCIRKPVYYAADCRKEMTKFRLQNSHRRKILCDQSYQEVEDALAEHVEGDTDVAVIREPIKHPNAQTTATNKEYNRSDCCLSITYYRSRQSKHRLPNDRFSRGDPTIKHSYGHENPIGFQ